jgi:AcrR family transcriptional regulator
MSSGNPETRARILRSVWELLENDPGRPVKMADIAKAAGISRQALYLHFPNRAELLVATTRFVDDEKDVVSRLAESRAAQTGVERLDAFIRGWCGYIPEIYPVAKVLMAAAESDPAAALAWKDRLDAIHHGCRAAVKALADDGMLSSDYSVERAADILWAQLSVRQWEMLTIDCGFSQEEYLATVATIARRLLVAG